MTTATSAAPDPRRPLASRIGNAALARARELARQGGKVFPCTWIQNGVCSCSKACGTHAGKHPMPAHGHKDSTSNERQIEAWAVTWPRANWAFVPGSLNQVVIDIDGPEGQQAFSALPGYESLPDTYMVRTGREGGCHIYFALPEGMRRSELLGSDGEVKQIRSQHRKEHGMPSFKTEKPEKDLYRIRNVADRMSLCERTIRRAIADGKIRTIRCGSSVLIPADELRRVLEKGF